MSLAAAACRRPPENAARDAAPSPPAEGSALTAGTSTPVPVALHPAARCGECHGAITKEWRGSAHARADTSLAYAAMQKATSAAACERCHAPLLRFAEVGSLASKDAVACDVCHTLREPERPSSFTMHLEDIVKYGPLCDAKSNYFHKMGCSPFHGTSDACAGCHSLRWTTPKGDLLTVQSEFEEWRASNYAVERVECQNCHMPGALAAVAVGSSPRSSVGSHAFDLASLRSGAVALRMNVRRSGQNVAVVVNVKNERAGHDVPTGVPERRLVLRVEVRDATGTASAKAARWYGRFLVDDRGPAPFYEATRVESDTRIHANESRDESFTLAAPRRGEVVAALVFVDVAPGIALRLGVTPKETTVLEIASPFGGRSSAGRPQDLSHPAEP